MSFRIVVASKNPVKIKAAQSAFTEMFSAESFECEGISVASGVADQPMSDQETFLGAETRVKNARETVPEADYWVGIEGGIQLEGQEMQAFAWIVIQSKKGLQGKAKTGTLFLPPAVVKLVLEGKELGEADDIVFKQKNSKQAGGAVGLLTDHLIQRTDYYHHAVLLALIPFRNEQLYGSNK